MVLRREKVADMADDEVSVVQPKFLPGGVIHRTLECSEVDSKRHQTPPAICIRVFPEECVECLLAASQTVCGISLQRVPGHPVVHSFQQ